MSHPAPSTFPGGAGPADRNREPARSFQHYEVLRRPDGSAWELGRGTMGVTYKAFDVNLCCEVALKVVNTAMLDHPNARERFVREARAAAALRHRNVASVYHLGNDAEQYFYAMEFIDGETLDALVRRQGPLPVEAALQVMLQTARALAAADRQKLVHRDIKPANIMVVHEDADEHMVVKVIDFGLARPAAGEGTSVGGLTANGFLGTPQFASPEQLEERALDARSDIYSLGVTGWFLLTGKPPFTGSLATICTHHLNYPPPWEQLPGHLPAPVRRLLEHMLEKDPARRPQNAGELRRGIEGCCEALARTASPDPGRANQEGRATFVPAKADTARVASGSGFGSGSSFAGGFSGFDAPSDAGIYSEGSISDRLTLVAGDPSPVGRWLFAVALLAGVFVLAVAGVWIFLAQHLPPEDAKRHAPPVKNVPGEDPARATRRHSASSPRPATPPPLPVEAVHAPPPSPGLADAGSRPLPAPATAAGLAQAAAGTPSPPVASAPEKLVHLRIKSIPGGAEIRTEGRTLGTTPLETDLPPGSHELMAHREGWPETREIVTLDADDTEAATEIHLMPPGLVPTIDDAPTAAPDSRSKRLSSAGIHASPTRIAPTGGKRTAPAAPAVAVEPSTGDTPVPARRTEPEVRRALPPLTPFDPDPTPTPRGTDLAAPVEAFPRVD